MGYICAPFVNQSSPVTKSPGAALSLSMGGGGAESAGGGSSTMARAATLWLSMGGGGTESGGGGPSTMARAAMLLLCMGGAESSSVSSVGVILLFFVGAVFFLEARGR